jgi:hypothetical protein
VIFTQNLPFLSAISSVKEMKIEYFAEIGLKALLIAFQPKDFQRLTIKELLFGYEDHFASLICKFKWDLSSKDLGLLSYRNGLFKQKFTVTRGINDISGLGQFSAVDDKKFDTMWTTDECNRIHGSDIVFYNSTALNKKEMLFLFSPELHRAVPIHFVEKVKKF